MESFQSLALRGVAWVVFGVCLVATGIGYYISLSQVEDRNRDRFNLQSSRVVQAIQDLMTSHEQVLKGAAGLFAASQTVERKEWRDYVDRIDIEESYRGIRALGYIERVPSARVDEFIRSNRLDGPLDFDIWPPERKAEHWVVKFVEPEAINASALGYDISSEPTREEAAKLARDTGEPALTRRIQLVQTVEEEPAVLLLLPIYRNGSLPQTVAERQAALQGWVYGALVVEHFINRLVESKDAGIDFEIFDDNTNKISLKTWIYDADHNLHATNPEKCTFHQNVPFPVVNRTWTAHFNTRRAFDAATDYSESRLLLIGGICISFLLFGITRSLASTRQRALGLARQMTEKFRIQERAVIASSNGIFITDASAPHQPLIYANPAMERIVERTFDELAGQGVDTFLNADPLQPELRELQTAMREGRECRVVLSRLWPGKSACWMEVTVAPVKDAHGIVNHYVGVAEDISERRRAEEALRATNALQRAILDSAGYAVISTSPDGLIRIFNAAAERMTGYKAAEVIGKPTSMLIHDWTDVEKRAHELSAELGRPVHPDFEVFVAKARLGQADEHEWTYVRKDGTKLPVLLSVTPVRDEHGVILGFMGIASDITERKRGEAQLQQATQAAEAANRAKGEFLANMSHEIRTPMNAVIGMTELALGTELTSEQRSYLVAARRSASDLLTIIDDVLDFSKIEAGKLELHPAPFRLREALEFGLKSFKVRAAEKQLELDLSVASDVPDTLVGDAGRLRQVVNNLVGNALKFTGHGRVGVDVKQDRAANLSPGQLQLHFTVSDTGIGVSLDKQKLIFGAFTQADASVTRRYGGTGLGLAISDKLSHLMGGTIWVDSELGKGSRFHFTAVFDLAGNSASISGENPEDNPANVVDDLLRLETEVSGMRPLRVLLAEDNPVNRELATTILDKLGHTVVPVSNGREAVDAWAGGGFDLILMDVQMPAMDGLEATTNIRQREQGTGQHIPIVGLTAHAMKGDREQGLAVGMDEYVTKPLRLEDLVRAIRKWIPQAGNGKSETETTFQHARLLDSLNGDLPAMQRLVGIFLESTPPLVEKLRAAAATRSAMGVMHAAHTLKGSLSHLHETYAHAVAVELEHLARAGNMDKVPELVIRLEHHLNPFEERLREWLRESSPATPSI